ncbi:hypothetical protein AVEN_98529-1 [Araneus ventricosus]|uniref:Uncharacterized protein n=1 Tax=Araneus ventricosus TaxID=182803 RepID=A0A4Y2K6P4_ARAVE|nr:hypothetical protein AVEN_98529-1 [Araneus ventricosus]
MMLYSQILEKHETQVIGAIALVHISNANSQQFTSNNSNSTFRFNNTNSQQITNNDSDSTFNSSQLNGFPARTADSTSVFPVDQHTPLRDPSTVLLYSPQKAVT